MADTYSNKSNTLRRIIKTIGHSLTDCQIILKRLNKERDT